MSTLRFEENLMPFLLREADNFVLDGRAIAGAGALDYLAKPVSLRVLMAKIAGWRARGSAA